MRIRSIKPEFWRSEDVSRLPLEDRLLFIGLWSYVDDNGVGVDDDATIIGDLFARDMFRESRETVARVSRGLSALSHGGLIVRYSVADRAFLFITNWEKHQRIDKPARPRFPRPDDDSAILAPSSRHSRETLAPGTGEQGNRGTGEQGSLSPDESDDAVLISDDWRPNQSHIDKAASLHLDVKAEYQRFREHAVRKHRRLKGEKGWNAGFTNWLRKQAEYRQERQGSAASQTFAQQKQSNTLALVEQYREEEAREEVGSRDAARLQALA